MGRIRKIVIAAVAVLTAGAAVFSVVNSVKAKQLSHAVRIEDALVGKAPDAGDELYLEIPAGDLFKLSDELYSYEFVYEDSNFVVPVRADGELEHRTMLYVVVEDSNPGMPDKVAQAYRVYYQELLDKLLAKKAEGLSEDSQVTSGRLDELIAMMEGYVTDECYEKDKSYVTSYTLKATGIPDYSVLAFSSGGIAVLLGLVLIYSILGIWISGKKLVIGSTVIFLAAAVTGIIVFRKEIATMMSIREYAPGMYICNVQNDYKLDELLAADIRDADMMIEAGSKALLGGLPVSTDAHHFACSSFSCVTPEGFHLFGRNYDYMDTDGMILYSDQEGAYASIAVCDLHWVGMAGDNAALEPDSLLGRFIMRGTGPLISVDGFNDQGLGVSILTLDYPGYREDTAKPDTLVLLMIRAILDKCANVDEAVALLDSYDVHSMFAYDFHLFITDKSGKSIVAEWIDGELTVTPIDYVTNYTIASHQFDDERRFVILKDRLSETEGKLTVGEALDLLNDAAQNDSGATIHTEWSCVYDLDNFVLYIYNDCNRQNLYIISPESFA